MKCPNCPDTALVMSDRQGVEIDYCPMCRGVWLDRGELDKLIERAAVPMTPASGAAHHHSDADSDYRGSGGRSSSDRRKSWLSDIFD
jgi:uncharacterized protein